MDSNVTAGSRNRCWRCNSTARRPSLPACWEGKQCPRLQPSSQRTSLLRHSTARRSLAADACSHPPHSSVRAGPRPAAAAVRRVMSAAGAAAGPSCAMRCTVRCTSSCASSRTRVPTCSSPIVRCSWRTVLSAQNEDVTAPASSRLRRPSSRSRRASVGSSDECAVKGCRGVGCGGGAQSLVSDRRACAALA